MVKRESSKISADRIVPSPVIVLPEGHPDLKDFNPNKVIVVPKTPGTAYLKTSPYRGSVKAEPGDGSLVGNEKDAPDLSDISVYTPLTRKRKAGSNSIYYEIVFKVRNSSPSPQNIIGVDARIVGTEPLND